jgi:hypothetical protein
MKTLWWHYAYVPVIYLHIPCHTVIWRYMTVYVGISGCQDSRCTYRYVLVRSSTYRYRPVQEYVTGTYWYVLVRSRNRAWRFRIHPGSAPRVNCNSVHLPCRRYDRMMSNVKKCKVQVRIVYTSMYWYVLERHGTGSIDIQVNHTRTSFRCCFRRSPTPASLHCTLDLFHARNAFPQPGSSLLHRETT